MDALKNPVNDYFENNEQFEIFSLQHLEHWKNIILDWINNADKILIVFYEDFIEDKMRQIEKVLYHLKIQVNQNRLKCVKFASLNFYKRQTYTKLKKNEPRYGYRTKKKSYINDPTTTKTFLQVWYFFFS